MVHSDLPVNSLNSGIKSGCKTTSSPSTNQTSWLAGGGKHPISDRTENWKKFEAKLLQWLGARACMSAWYAGASLLCQIPNSRLYLEKKGRDAESVDAGEIQPDSCLQSSLWKKACRTQTLAWVFQLVHTAQPPSLATPVCGVYPAQSHFVMVLI